MTPKIDQQKNNMSKTSNKVVVVLSILIITLGSSCSFRSTNNLPVIKVDGEHDFVFMDNHAGENPPIILRYQITEGDGVLLDVSDYDIGNKIPPDLLALGITHPNRIAVSIEYDGGYKTIYYYVDWVESDAVISLTTETLMSVKGEKTFAGFEAGQSATINIGFYARVFYRFWSAGVDVTP